MRILHVIASADLREGGPIEHAIRSGHALALRGHRQDFLTFDPPATIRAHDVGAQVFAFGTQRPQTGWLGKLTSVVRDVPHAVHWLRTNVSTYDVIVVSGLWNVATLTARLCLPRRKTPYVVFTHGMLDPYFRRANQLKWFFKQISWFGSEAVLVRKADRVLFTCAEERRLARESFRPYSACERVVSFGTADAPPANAAQQADFQKQVPALKGRPFLLFLSRIHEKKGIDLLIRAFGALTREGADGGVDLVIAGPDSHGLREELERMAQAEGVADRIHWPGMVKDDAKWGAFRSCEAFILPSHQENFGIVVAEALACGRPVLLSDKVNIWREVAEDEAGIVGPDTVEGTIATLRKFLSCSAERRATMGRNARASFLRRYDLDNAVGDFEQVLHEVIEERRAIGIQ